MPWRSADGGGGLAPNSPERALSSLADFGLHVGLAPSPFGSRDISGSFAQALATAAEA